MRLESHLQYLDRVASGLLESNNKERRTTGTGSAQQYGVATLVRALLLSRRFRDKSCVAESIEKAMELLPYSLRQAASEVISAGNLQVPSQPVLQRFQLIFDVGVMLWRRAQVASDVHCCRFLRSARQMDILNIMFCFLIIEDRLTAND